MNNEEVGIKLENHEQRIVGADHKIKDLEGQTASIQSLAMSTQELAISVKNMTEEQKSQALDML